MTCLGGIIEVVNNQDASKCTITWQIEDFIPCQQQCLSQSNGESNDGYEVVQLQADICCEKAQV